MSRILRRAFNIKSLEPGCRISPKTHHHAENALFQWEYQFFQILPGIKSLYDRGRKLIHLLAEEA